MTVLVDETKAPPGEPGVHALVIGISAYPHLDSREHPDKTLGLTSLDSAALTAHRMANWLIERTEHLLRPLHSCRLVVAPTGKEIHREPELEQLSEPCDKASVARQIADWRRAASTHSDNVTLFYFAGHGVQPNRTQHVLLMQDFADGREATLDCAIGTAPLKAGMAPSSKRRKVARTQVYFFDACRTAPRKLRGLEQAPVGTLWDVDPLDLEDDRVIAAFHTARPGKASFGVRGQQSLFSLALMACLEGGAAEVMHHDPQRGERWGVSLQSLNSHLTYQLDKVNRKHKAKQVFGADELRGDAWLHRLDDPPPVDIELRLVPSDAAELTGLRIFDSFGRKAWELSAPVEPERVYPESLAAGNYSALGRATLDSKSRDLPPQGFAAKPPNGEWYFRVPAATA